MLRAFAALWLALTFWAAPSLAQPSFPPLAGSPVVDAANIIDEATEAQLNQQLLAFNQRTQRQFAIATIPSLDGYDIADYGYQLGRAWGIGDAQRNDGVLLIVAPNDRKMRIEVGYGLEGTLPDGLAFDYVEDAKPLFREERYSEGIAQAASQIITQLELPPEEAARIAAEAAKARESEGGVPVGMLIWFAFVLMFIIVPKLMGHGGRRRYRRGGDLGGAVGDIILWEAGKAVSRGMFGGGGGGWGGGGGGFSGGGGSFGGGGASGGW